MYAQCAPLACHLYASTSLPPPHPLTTPPAHHDQHHLQLLCGRAPHRHSGAAAPDCRGLPLFVTIGLPLRLLIGILALVWPHQWQGWMSASNARDAQLRKERRSRHRRRQSPLSRPAAARWQCSIRPPDPHVPVTAAQTSRGALRRRARRPCPAKERAACLPLVRGSRSLRTDRG